MKNKPYSESSDQNKDVICEVISPILSGVTSVLEIGSGTGQHAIFFAEKMPHLIWHTSDRQDYISGINCWLDDIKIGNVVAPVELDVSSSIWPSQKMDAVFTANTVHIMNQDEVEYLIKGCSAVIKPGGHLLMYGPFNYNGNYTSESNERFDQWLKSRDVLSCIKDFETVSELALENGLLLKNDYAMPANNRILHFIRMDTDDEE